MAPWLLVAPSLPDNNCDQDPEIAVDAPGIARIITLACVTLACQTREPEPLGVQVFDWSDILSKMKHYLNIEENLKTAKIILRRGWGSRKPETLVGAKSYLLTPTGSFDELVSADNELRSLLDKTILQVSFQQGDPFFHQRLEPKILELQLSKVCTSSSASLPNPSSTILKTFDWYPRSFMPLHRQIPIMLAMESETVRCTHYA
ncbi:hypothetical protein QCA50_019101 [Cerrena zonata]|uniref:Uncharacterized protein n=1 Tax=Cerrena zonata TaxID=2478898 RepID=A0AAW0FKN4_9APHY